MQNYQRCISGMRGIWPNGIPVNEYPQLMSYIAGTSGLDVASSATTQTRQARGRGTTQLRQTTRARGLTARGRGRPRAAAKGAATPVQNPTQQRLVELLKADTLPAKDIAKRLQMRPGSVATHLGHLKRQGVPVEKVTTPAGVAFHIGAWTPSGTAQRAQA